MSLAKKVVWRQLREHTSYRARRLLHSGDRKGEISRWEGSIRVLILIFPAPVLTYIYVFTSPPPPAPGHLNNAEEYAGLSTCTWVNSQQDKAAAVPQIHQLQLQRREGSLREKCKWHGQQNNVALSEERTQQLVRNDLPVHNTATPGRERYCWHCKSSYISKCFSCIQTGSLQNLMQSWWSFPAKLAPL